MGDLLRRREFLVRFCQGAGATLIPARLWNWSARPFPIPSAPAAADGPTYHLRPHYRNQGPLDATLLKVLPGFDAFVTEKYADQIQSILQRWSAVLLRSPIEIQSVGEFLAQRFSGSPCYPSSSRLLRSHAGIQVEQRKFPSETTLPRETFLRELQASFAEDSAILNAQFQITSLKALPATSMLDQLETRVRYEIVGAGSNFYRKQRVGEWELLWERFERDSFRLRSWRWLSETMARATSPVYVDVTAAALGGNSSYEQQLLYGTDYWRTVLDGASGIDIYGHNGVSVADIDNDGFDDLYVCQPAGIPNRLYRNRGGGTFEDITEASGLGVLENTACALFADFNNDGLQDVVVVRANGPLLFVNDGGGKFRLSPDAFQFATLPQGTFTGAAVADYDRDGWLDVYFCLYSYYQGTGQYRYPSPYHDAENGPPNFMMRNQRDGTFRDVTAAAGLNQNNTRYSFCCAWNDYNDDGWPDLYVVNDFGRKNLYRNNGDGTFTDVAAELGVEDVGAGMSVGWLDYDNDGRPDLYVANMWTAAGERISTQDNFKSDSPPEIRALYQKHAMGNSLFHNRGGRFENVSNSSETRMGRWSWSSDSFDFDHDGFPDLYVANGMVSGPSREGLPQNDLNSFFWRQVVANSPDVARAASDYEAGWNAINELIRSDGTWSGYERNVFYANNRDGSFSDVSAAVGLDFVEDGRSFAVADFDHDGRLEIVLKNRNGPQLRILKNVVAELPPSIAFRLQGRPHGGLQEKNGNRDAIGATVSIQTSAGSQVRSLVAGSGFLSQHSKDIFFGLGEAKGTVQATIHWPSGTVQQLHNLPPNHRIWVAEGSEPSRVEAFRETKSQTLTALDQKAEVLPTQVQSWLLEPFPAPDFTLSDSSGKTRTLSSLRGTDILLCLWSAKAPNATEFLQNLSREATRSPKQNPSLIVIDFDDEEHPPQPVDGLIYLRGSNDAAAIYNIVYRQLFDRHRDLGLPTSFLINSAGEIIKIYQGAIDVKQIERDLQNVPLTSADRIKAALPFTGAIATFEFGRNYLSFGSILFQRGYLDEAEKAFQRALRDDPSSAEALYGIGSVYLNQDKNAAARETFERAIKLQPSYPETLPDSWNNLGVIATREGQYDDSIECFLQALKADPNHLLSLDNLANAYRAEKRWDDARKVLDRVIAIAPEDAEANYSLGMVFAQTGENDKAYDYLQRALKARPNYPEAMNNLGVLYLMTERRDDAVASFEKCIRIAPGFDQAYLNLARVYALEGARDKARGVLLELLKQNPQHEQAKQMLAQLQP
jgi:tetratricopeptide (TPR) repeat protein